MRVMPHLVADDAAAAEAIEEETPRVACSTNPIPYARIAFPYAMLDHKSPPCSNHASSARTLSETSALAMVVE